MRGDAHLLNLEEGSPPIQPRFFSPIHLIKCGVNTNSELVIKADARVQEPKGRWTWKSYPKSFCFSKAWATQGSTIWRIVILYIIFGDWPNLAHLCYLWGPYPLSVCNFTLYIAIIHRSIIVYFHSQFLNCFSSVRW